MMISFTHHLLPVAIAALAGVAAVLYVVSFSRSRPRIFMHLLMAGISLYMAAIYALLMVGSIIDLAQLSELIRPALPLLFAGIIAERLRNAATH